MERSSNCEGFELQEKFREGFKEYLSDQVMSEDSRPRYLDFNYLLINYNNSRSFDQIIIISTYALDVDSFGFSSLESLMVVASMVASTLGSASMVASASGSTSIEVATGTSMVAS